MIVTVELAHSHLLTRQHMQTHANTCIEPNVPTTTNAPPVSTLQKLTGIFSSAPVDPSGAQSCFAHCAILFPCCIEPSLIWLSFYYKVFKACSPTTFRFIQKVMNPSTECLSTPRRRSDGNIFSKADSANNRPKFRDNTFWQRMAQTYHAPPLDSLMATTLAPLQ